jgi:DMSO/TMAO reductase YedYZ molybdopterin-dependent catalytic subunit
MLAQVPMSQKGLIRRIPLKPHQMTRRLTPIDDVFMLSHLGIPEVDPDQWRLEVAGLVEKSISLSLADLQAFPKESVESVHECAGNPFTPNRPKRRVCNVVWSGARLVDVLNACGLRGNPKYIWSFGADYGELDGDHVDAYGKDLPMQRVDEGDVLIAYELNGEPLPQEHGFPARLFVPGYYGTNSVKWLSRIELADKRYRGLFTAKYYLDVLPGRNGARDNGKPVWAIAPESIIRSPAPKSTVSGEVAISGWAWGYHDIRTVEVSTDGARTWTKARLGKRRAWSWQGFSLRWTPPGPGTYTLMCRATDTENVTQPMNGMRNAVHAVPVTIKGR